MASELEKVVAEMRFRAAALSLGDELDLDTADELRQWADRLAAMGWRPISEAPKDGTDFLAVANYKDEPPQTHVVDWDYVESCEPGLYTLYQPLPAPPEGA